MQSGEKSLKPYANLRELPIWNFSEAKANFDLRYLLILDDYSNLPKVSEELENELVDLWDKLEIEQMETFGLTNEFIDRVRLKKEIMILELSDPLEENHNALNVLNRLKNEFDRLYGSEEEEKALSLEREAAIIEKYLGFSINLKKVSVIKYYSYVEMMREEAKKIINEQTKLNNG